MSVTKREYIHPDTRKLAWGYDFTFDRKRYRKAGYRTQVEAERAERRAREQLGAGKRLRPVRRVKVTELLDLFFEDYAKTKTAKSWRREQYRSKALRERFGNQYVDQVKADQITRHMDQRGKDGLQPRAVNLELVLLRNSFRFALKQGYALNNPAKEVPYKPCQRKERPIPTPEEFTRFLTEAGKTRTGRQLIIWLTLLALSGERPSEALFLEWPELDFHREKILIREKPEHGNPLKKGGAREIEMHPRLKELLLEWRREWEKLFDGEAPPHQWVFVNPANPKKRAEGFRTAFRHARERAGLPDLRPYTLRHLFCSFSLMNGVDKDVLRQWMGHKSFQMIDQVYSHFLADYRRQQMAKVQIALPSPGNGNVLPGPAELAS